jgi:hypothetical protein
MTAREQVIDDLTELHARLKQAQADHDNGAAVLARYDIDEALERLHGVASVEEYGPCGTAPE